MTNDRGNVETAFAYAWYARDIQLPADCKSQRRTIRSRVPRLREPTVLVPHAVGLKQSARAKGRHAEDAKVKKQHALIPSLQSPHGYNGFKRPRGISGVLYLPRHCFQMEPQIASASQARCTSTNRDPLPNHHLLIKKFQLLAIQASHKTRLYTGMVVLH